MFLAAAYLHCARESPTVLTDLDQAIEKHSSLSHKWIGHTEKSFIALDR
jgi:hypothetical protein